jgi:hypothetical protein
MLQSAGSPAGSKTQTQNNGGKDETQSEGSFTNTDFNLDWISDDGTRTSSQTTDSEEGSQDHADSRLHGRG